MDRDRLADEIGRAPAPADAQEEDVVATIVAHTARELGVAADAVDPRQRFLAMGADSLLMVNVVRHLEDRYGITVSMRELFEEANSPALLARLVRERMAPVSVVVSGRSVVRSAVVSGLRVGLSFFGRYPQEGSAREAYALVLGCARFADEAGLDAVWLPERHFHEFGGVFPNPSVLAAAIACVTERVRIHAGSVVLPLHDPIRVAEEWSVVDNLSNGRTGLAIASGYHANDFVLQPEAYGRHREIMWDSLDAVRTLWRGGPLRRTSGTGESIDVRLHPLPVQEQPPLYAAVVGRPESWRRAGAEGLGVLTNLMTQDVDDLAANIACYRDARAQAGRDPDAGHVVVLLHTYLAQTDQQARADARDPFCTYLRSSLSLLGDASNSLGFQIDLERSSEDELAYLAERAFERYCDGRALIGTVDSCTPLTQRLADAGANELACFIDFGADAQLVRENLPHVARLRDRVAPQADREPGAPVVRVATPSAVELGRPLLFCLAHAGASATSAYHAWGERLHDVADVVPLELAGHGPRVAEAAPPDLETAAAECAERIRERVRAAPFALFGHSIGGLLAYEIDRLLQDGPRPAALVIAATPPPGSRTDAQLHELPDASFVAAVSELGGLPELVLEHPEARAFHLAVLRADYRLVERYELPPAPHRVAAPLLLLEASDDPLRHADDANRWRRLAGDRVTTRTLPGAGHFFPSDRLDETIAVVRAFLAVSLGAAGAPQALKPPSTTSVVPVT